MVCITKEVSSELLPFVRVFKDGSVERLIPSPSVPPSPEDTKNGVFSKDITISKDVSARIYLPKPTTPTQRFPVLAYFHGGGFCIDSAFSFLCHRYLNTLASTAKVLIVSVEYRLAPEHPVPTAYDDSWAALQWIVSQSIKGGPMKEAWLERHANFERVYVGGDSAGANIAHNITLRASQEKLQGGIKIFGALLSQPYFLGTQPIGLEPKIDHDKSLLYKTWEFVYPNAEGGFDNPFINPFANDAPSLAWMGCSRVLVCVSEKDELRERGVRYFEALKKSGWKGKAELFEVEGEDHCFHIFNLDSEKAKIMLRRLSLFFAASSNN